ncbi:PilZ domain-containing protein [Fusibacter bizertensis]|jgi:PilZ domain.|uniref:PilZ domain-containing protein n=1 Tax=Fusibacter bizertensis TaxID=1488331 RepID=A0ABT6N9Y6_9FIRM|nr:PilZ domain-containing protein [Fusibacter bizertensis]MDH8677227.1 PilZ domain-containing protein [Fusibacter bizertensis]
MDRRREKRISNLGVIESFNFHANNQEVVINSPLEISLVDISVGGLGIKSNIMLEEDTTLSIAIQHEDVNFVVIGRIVWCRREDQIYNCGLKLIYLPSELNELLEEVVEQENKYIN